MVKKSNYIIIGSTGRNTGKTEFACRLIKQYSPKQKIIGVKVVAINKCEGNCPRGGKGCGVCTSLKGDYEIFEETKLDPAKDTSRMLIAGAHKVYFLKVDKDFLEKGIKALVKTLPPDAMVVLESNSIRKVIEPGLFLVIKNLNERKVKESCAEVISYANKIIEFDNMSWDFPPERVIVKNNSWFIRQKATAIVLAGGKSSRMGGEDKSMLLVNGMPLIQHIVNQLDNHFDEVIIGANDVEKYSFLGKKVVPDIERDKGPLMGIYSCLKESSSDVNFITACDIPEMNMKLIQNMINLSTDVDIVMPVKDGDKHEPLYAVYKKSATEEAKSIISRNGRRIIELLNNLHVKLVEFNDDGWYQNLNLKVDYEIYINKVKERKCFRESME